MRALGLEERSDHCPTGVRLVIMDAIDHRSIVPGAGEDVRGFSGQDCPAPIENDSSVLSVHRPGDPLGGTVLTRGRADMKRSPPTPTAMLNLSLDTPTR